MAPTQRVFRLPQRNSVNDLTLCEEEVPKPSTHEVLIRIRSVALNFRDFAVATGKYPFPVKENVVPCSDLAGEIVSLGSGIEDFAAGDRVIASFDLKTLSGAMQDWHHSLGGVYDGALRQFITLPSSALVKIPSSAQLSFAQLSALVYWYHCLERAVRKYVIEAWSDCTGGVSITGLILAKAAGAKTIITSSSDSKLQHVQNTYGADQIINYKSTPDWPKELLKITDGRGADFIFENGGAGTIAQSIDSVAYGGSIAVIGFLASCEQDQMPDVAALALAKGAVVRGIMVGSTEHLKDVTKFVTSKNLQVPVEKVYGFSREEVVSAFEYLVSGQNVGKVCINVD